MDHHSWISDGNEYQVEYQADEQGYRPRMSIKPLSSLKTEADIKPVQSEITEDPQAEPQPEPEPEPQSEPTSQQQDDRQPQEANDDSEAVVMHIPLPEADPSDDTNTPIKETPPRTDEIYTDDAIIIDASAPPKSTYEDNTDDFAETDASNYASAVYTSNDDTRQILDTKEFLESSSAQDYLSYLNAQLQYQEKQTDQDSQLLDDAGLVQQSDDLYENLSSDELEALAHQQNIQLNLPSRYGYYDRAAQLRQYYQYYQNYQNLLLSQMYHDYQQRLFLATNQRLPYPYQYPQPVYNDRFFDAYWRLLSDYYTGGTTVYRAGLSEAKHSKFDSGNKVAALRQLLEDDPELRTAFYEQLYEGEK